ncbi:glutamyl-tRNA synthetase [Vibrio sp. qd031]|uniref:tRNA glutamyl-Q(34) synthetase GluQRS n=1 Tax=Vibrio sp. qd031 TaxID=1603038 RepID=UPI000A0F7ED9|nr:tRNA glutamyl-Q(34) synthetase GluQRS [Vibrio sp. qd031]ORT48879.1 glutamyl-tRNA synthetase [Vibrio sp. qd031]
MHNVIGRFAPSPSGPLHFGSLVAALGSYFHARSQNGQWLVRIEDLDPPREMAGADSLILKALEAYGLHWDQQVLYQSQRLADYQAQIDDWLERGDAYYCQCTRKQIKQSGGYYLGTCRTLGLPARECSVRITVDSCIDHFSDLRHGKIAIPAALAKEDFIIKRRDGLFAYNLAVVLDDIYQGITQVVRGADLIEPTGRQIHLYTVLGQTIPDYLHLPLAMQATGGKLSKQNHAPAISTSDVVPTLCSAMQFLGFSLPDDVQQGSTDEIIAWGVSQWRISQLPDEIEVITPFSIGSS